MAIVLVLALLLLFCVLNTVALNWVSDHLYPLPNEVRFVECLLFGFVNGRYICPAILNFLVAAGGGNQ